MYLPKKEIQTWLVKLSVVTSLLLAAPFCFPGTSEAERTRESCDAVSEMAEIDYDTRLIVTIVKHATKYICVFRVGFGPSGGSHETGAQTALQFQRLYGSNQDSNFVALVSKDLTPSLVEALVEPLKDSRFADERNSVETAISERSNLIDACAVDAILKREIPFAQRDDVIACGLSNSIFVLQVTYRAMTIALFIPTH